MFPIPFNFPFRKSDGSVTTIADAIDAGGGGGSYELPTASAETKGGVKIGAGLTMDGETLNNTNPTPYSLPIASSENLGGVKVGAGLAINVETGELSNSNPTPYSLPTASDAVLGGVKVGAGLAINDGVLSASGATKLWENDDITYFETKNITLLSDKYTHLIVYFLHDYLNPTEPLYSCILKKNVNGSINGAGVIKQSASVFRLEIMTRLVNFTDATHLTINKAQTCTVVSTNNTFNFSDGDTAKIIPTEIWGF